MSQGPIRLAATLCLLGAVSVCPIHAMPQGTRRGSAAPVRAGGTASEASCLKAVQAFYDYYLPRLMREVHVTAMEQAIRNKPRWFSKELRRGLADDLAAAKNSPDEIVSLDFEPIVNSQDPASRYVVKQVSRVGRSYRANVHSVVDSKAGERPDVIAEVVLNGGHWMFVNFHYPAMERGETGTDLLKLLKELKADRRRPAKRIRRD